MRKYGHFLDIFKENDSDVIVEATAPFRGGYDFPIHQNPVRFSNQVIYGMTPQIQIFSDKLSGVTPPITTEPVLRGQHAGFDSVGASPQEQRNELADVCSEKLERLVQALARLDEKTVDRILELAQTAGAQAPAAAGQGLADGPREL